MARGQPKADASSQLPGEIVGELLAHDKEHTLLPGCLPQGWLRLSNAVRKQWGNAQAATIDIRSPSPSTESPLRNSFPPLPTCEPAPPPAGCTP